MQDNPFPSLAIGNDDEEVRGEEDALLQLSGQEEAMLPGPGQGGDELELLEPPPNTSPEEATLINPGDWNDASVPGTRGSATTLEVEGVVSGV